MLTMPDFTFSQLELKQEPGVDSTEGTGNREAKFLSANLTKKGTTDGIEGSKGENNCGRWNEGEHKVFAKYLQIYGKDWKKIAEQIDTRSPVQVRTHAQKYFLKLENAYTRKNRFLSDEELRILKKFVLSKRMVERSCSKLKRKHSSSTTKKSDYSEVYPVPRRLKTEADDFILVDGERHCELDLSGLNSGKEGEQDPLDLLHNRNFPEHAGTQKLSCSDYDPDVWRPWIYDPLCKVFNREFPFKTGMDETFRLKDELIEDDVMDMLCVL